MKRWIENRRVLAAFSDPAGAKAVLAYLNLYRVFSKSITVISDREYSFYQEFGFEVLPEKRLSFADWLSNCDVLITGTSYPARLELGLIDEAIKVGVPTISLVDHWINIAARYEMQGCRILPDVIGLVDEHAKKLAESEGLPTDRLHVIGNPHHEYLNNWKPTISKNNLLSSLGLDIKKPFFLYVPEPISRFGLKVKYGFDEIDGLNLLRQARREVAGMEFSIIVKAHPNQDHQIFIDNLAENNDPDTIYLTDGDINTLCVHAQAVIGFFSNALIEATILGATVIRPLMLLQKNTLDPLLSQSENKFIDTFSINEFADAIRSPILINSRL